MASGFKRFFITDVTDKGCINIINHFNLNE